MYSRLFLRRIHLLQFDNNNTQFVIAFSWQWRIVLVDGRCGIAPVVDCRVGLLSFRSAVDDVVPCHPVG